MAGSPTLGRLASSHRCDALDAGCACEPAETVSVYCCRGKGRIAVRHEAGANAAREGATKPELPISEVLLHLQLQSLPFNLRLTRHSFLTLIKSFAMVAAHLLVASVIAAASATRIGAREDAYFTSLLKRQEPGTPAYNCHDNWFVRLNLHHQSQRWPNNRQRLCHHSLPWCWCVLHLHTKE